MPDASILIVEDEVIVAADLANKLGRLGYTVCGSTARGEDALALDARPRPDLVLMDIRLAGEMDGVEAAEHIRRECDVPVIYLTAHADHATLDRAKRTEPFGYLLKPFEERELETHIEMALYKHQAEEALRLSEEKFARAFANNPAAITITRLDDGIFLEVNDTWVALNGYSREEAVGQSAKLLLSGRPPRAGRVSCGNCALTALCTGGSKHFSPNPASCSWRNYRRKCSPSTGKR